MASRKVPSASTKRDQDASENSKSLKSGGESSEANISGDNKRKARGTIVKSRYMQPIDKTALSKSNSLTNELVAVQPRPSSPKPSGARVRMSAQSRRSVAPQSSLKTSILSSVLEPANLGGTILQSTVLDGLDCNRPDFDVSVIKDKTSANTILHGKTMDKEKSIEDFHNETILLTYLTAKMESNTSKLSAEAEQQLLTVMEEEEQLSKELHEKKQQCLLLEKSKQMNELLDLQIAALTPVAEVIHGFTADYKSFGTAIDTTRHELPIKNFYIEGDRREFLDRVESSLKECEKLLLQRTRGAQMDNSTSVECLREMKKSARDIHEELAGAFSELSELSSLVSRHTINVQQTLEEEQLGPSRTKQLYCGQD